MLSLNSLWQTTGRKKSKRYGLGKGAGSKTNGRGQKGQKSRSGTHLPYAGFEGGQTPLQRRTPKRGFKNFARVEYAPVNISALSVFEAGVEVTPELLLERGIVRDASLPIKILGDGELTIKLSVKAHGFSQSAIAKIKSVGGSAEVI
ncbi:MAG: 50S ribosomal protein L15 [Candidatus Cloacimonetes bacterium]|nr:50S ribosomal protein L15 [Candidatus Cloacimonadota bacterium]